MLPAPLRRQRLPGQPGHEHGGLVAHHGGVGLDARVGEDRPHFTYVLVDCPPSLNLLTINAMCASHSVLVPLQCEFFALEGLSQLLSTVEQVKRSLNNELSIHGIVLTMYDGRNNLSAQVVQDVRTNMGDAVYETIIPRNVRLAEAPSYGKPVIAFDRQSRGAQAYSALAQELLDRRDGVVRQYAEQGAEA